MAGENECIACMNSLPAGDLSLKCSEFENKHHTGKCSGVTKKSLQAMTAESVNAWKCNTCKVHVSRQYETSDERGPAERERATSSGARELNIDKLPPTNEDIYKKLTDILNRMEGVEKSLEKQSSKDNEIITKLDGHGKTVEAIDASMSTLSGKYDELLKRLDEQSATIKKLTKRTGQLEVKITEQDLQSGN
ncbi:unnamed protein product [Ixodes pacificus]